MGLGPAPDRAALLYALDAERAGASTTGAPPRWTAPAQLVGFEYRPRPKAEERRPVVEPARGSSAPPVSASAGPAPRSEIRFEPVTFWRPVEREYREDLEGRELPRPEPLATRPATREDLEMGSDGPPPAHVPIAPWPRLWRVLEDHLRTSRPRRALDIEALIRRWSRGESVRELPRRRGLAHAPLTVILDTSPRLMPFWLDQFQIVGRLIKRLDIYAVRFMDADVALRDGVPAFDAEERLLALTDLGIYGSASQRAAWTDLGASLARRSSPPVALVPASLERLATEAPSTWETLAWSEQGLADGSFDGPAAAGRTSTSPEVLREVLVLASMAQRLDHGLLRQLRRLVPATDLATEVALYQLDAVEGRSPRGLTLKADDVRRLRMEFAELPSLRQQRAISVLEARRAGQAPETLALEVGELLGCGVEKSKFDSDVLRTSLELLAGLARRVAKPVTGDEVMAADLDAWWSRLSSWASGALWLQPDLRADLEQASIAHAARHPEAPKAAGKTPEMLAAERTRKEPRHTIDVYQGPSGFMTRREAGASLVVSLASRGSGVLLNDPAGDSVELGDDPPTAPKPSTARAIVLSTDAEAVMLEPWRPVLDDPTAWCTDAGRDRFGLWAALEIGDVEARMRWIPPGRFWMGSPRAEKGRFGNEVRHEVLLTEGFWLAETPCTQAQWEAVMGSNPSEFPGTGDLPVECVSWEDSQRFNERVNSRLRHLELRLPTEAEWEYACRAGTQTANWRGDLAQLEAVSWYRENSQGKTQPVKAKPANPWGIFDPLGNVWEWCWDRQASYPVHLTVDPEGSQGGSYRVIRGGSWVNTARHVRAASRRWDPPGSRDPLLGFRWSRGRLQARGAEKELGRAASGRAARGMSGLTRHRRDRAWLDRLAWAHDGGIDEFGRWTSVQVGGVEARLRWICPGTFLMGSPTSEEGRSDGEGPQHQVTLAEGFWLGESPCTQDLWLEVTGSNPSEFQSPRRPVETVSWEDVQEFLAVLGQRVPHLEPRLPTEAQWEYACRAGTRTATWLGDLDIVGKRNASRLHDIAWYGGNSGVGFDLALGLDSSLWPEKQFPHREAGTREVALKSSNPWGLYDMLGNVLEWCQDWKRAYTSEAAVDPQGPERGSFRVLRGGSWDYPARGVRAAYRSWSHPDLRSPVLGFRWSLGQERVEDGVQGLVDASGNARRGTRG